MVYSSIRHSKSMIVHRSSVTRLRSVLQIRNVYPRDLRLTTDDSRFRLEEQGDVDCNVPHYAIRNPQSEMINGPPLRNPQSAIRNDKWFRIRVPFGCCAFEVIPHSEFGYPLGVPNLGDSTFHIRHLEWIPPLFSDRIKSAICNPQSEIEEPPSH